MSNIKDLQTLIKEVEADFNTIKKTDDFNTASKLERKCIEGIRYMQIGVSRVFDELREICLEQRKKIRQGFVAEKPVKEPAKKPAKKAKKTTKKK